MLDQPSFTMSNVLPHSVLNDSDSNHEELALMMQRLKGNKQGYAEIRRGNAGPASRHWSRYYFNISHPSGDLFYQDGPTTVKLLSLRQSPIRAIDFPDRGVAVQMDCHPEPIFFQADSDAELCEWFAAFLCWQPLHPSPFSKGNPDLPRQSNKKVLNFISIKRWTALDVQNASNVFTSRVYYKAQTKISLPRSGPERSWKKVNLALREDGWLLIGDHDAYVESLYIPDLPRHCIYPQDVSMTSKPNCFSIVVNPITLRQTQKTANMNFKGTNIFSTTLSGSPSLSASPSSPIIKPVEFSSPSSRSPNLQSTQWSQVQSTSYTFQAPSTSNMHAWIIMLRGFALPEIFGCPLIDNDSYTIDRSLMVEVTDAKFLVSRGNNAEGNNVITQELQTITPSSTNYELESKVSNSLETHCVMLVDGIRRGRTATLKGSQVAYNEIYNVSYLPHVQASLVLQIVEHHLIRQSLLGQVEIVLWSLKRSDTHSGWYPILSNSSIDPWEGSEDSTSYLPNASPNTGSAMYPGDNVSRENIVDLRVNGPPVDSHVGDLRLRVRYDELMVLPLDEYKAIRKIMLDPTMGPNITLTLSQKNDALQPKNDKLPSVSGGVKLGTTDFLERIANNAIRIYQGEDNLSDKSTAKDGDLDAVSWLCILAKWEIERIDRSDPNLLFRSNTLLTKALDRYMRLIGQDYLEYMFSQLVYTLYKDKVWCEVDPSKLERGEDISQHWRRLKEWMHLFWSQVEKHKASCPNELRRIFAYIRQCVKERFGEESVETLQYTCISGFIFLRFICPALLNPKLFGLTRGNTDPKVQRTLTLLAKCMMTFANLFKFGTKEPWLVPMNEFINTQNASLKSFIDYICIPVGENGGGGNGVISISNSDNPNGHLEAALKATKDLRNRLPPAYRESLPSLPGLIDLSREYALLCATIYSCSECLFSSDQKGQPSQLDQTGHSKEVGGKAKENEDRLDVYLNSNSGITQAVEAAKDIENRVRERLIRTGNGVTSEQAVERIRDEIFGAQVQQQR